MMPMLISAAGEGVSWQFHCILRKLIGDIREDDLMAGILGFKGVKGGYLPVNAGKENLSVCLVGVALADCSSFWRMRVRPAGFRQ